MDSSVREQGSAPHRGDPKRLLVSLASLASIIKWLAGLIKLTEEEREEAGIYLDRVEANKYQSTLRISYTDRN